MSKAGASVGDARSERRGRILDAAHGLLRERGYAGVSMLDIARASRASKETLYAYFGDKRGLFEALVRENAAEMDRTLERALADPGGDAATALGRALLTLLMSERALTLNRVAVAAAAGGDTELGTVLARAGRQTSGAAMVALLRELDERGTLRVPDPAEALDTLIGLLLGDVQVRVLQGARPPLTPEEIDRRARRATELLTRLYAPDDQPASDAGTTNPSSTFLDPA